MRTHGNHSKDTITNKTRPAGSFSLPVRCSTYVYVFSLVVTCSRHRQHPTTRNHQHPPNNDTSAHQHAVRTRQSTPDNQEPPTPTEHRDTRHISNSMQAALDNRKHPTFKTNHYQWQPKPTIKTYTRQLTAVNQQLLKKPPSTNHAKTTRLEVKSPSPALPQIWSEQRKNDNAILFLISIMWHYRYIENWDGEGGFCLPTMEVDKFSVDLSKVTCFCEW